MEAPVVLQVLLLLVAVEAVALLPIQELEDLVVEEMDKVVLQMVAREQSTLAVEAVVAAAAEKAALAVQELSLYDTSFNKTND